MNLSNALKRKLLLGSLPILIIVLFAGFTPQNEEVGTEFLTVLVEYNCFRNYNYQRMTISSTEGETRIIFLAESRMSPERRAEFFGAESEIKAGKLKTLLDNSLVLEELKILGLQGWKLVEHGFLRSRPFPEWRGYGFEVDERTSQEFVANYLFEK